VIEGVNRHSDEYQDGYRQGVKDMAERIKTYYQNTTSRPLPATVEYYVDRLAKEMCDNTEE
jgi:hypothetical protein